MLLPDMSHAQSSTSNAVASKPEAPLLSTQDSQRSLLEIQEQIHNAQLAIEKSRSETESAVASNSKILEARFERMDAERIELLREIQHSDKIVLTVAGVIIFVAILILIASAGLQWATIRRITEATAQIHAGQSLQHLSLGDGQLFSTQALEQSNTRFLDMIERLEKRIGEIETGKQLTNANGEANGHVNGQANKDLENHGATASSTASQIRMLLGKGQTLLKLDQSEAALECLDELLAIDPGNLEALIKKGAALERLQRLPEAVACYDQVISRDSSMTIAYLYKGAVFNRMERHSEALECYELALKSRQKKEQAANIIFDGVD